METVPAAEGRAYREKEHPPQGEGLLTVIVALRQWGSDHCFEPGESYRSLVDSQTHKPVARMQVSAQDGRPLRPNDLQLERLAD